MLHSGIRLHGLGRQIVQRDHAERPVGGIKHRQSPDLMLRHQVLDKGQADLSIVFTTDPQIKRNGYVLLEDDQGMFPPYNSMLLVSDDTYQEAGLDLPEVVGKVQEGLTDEVIQELNARVDLDKKEPAEVAKEYLAETGLVK